MLSVSHSRLTQQATTTTALTPNPSSNIGRGVRGEGRRLPLHLQALNLSQLLHETVELFSDQAEERAISLTCHLPSDLPAIQADERRFRQVLHNLLANALRDTPTGGSVTISARQLPQSVEIAIADSGEGICPQALPHIFDRFYRRDKARSRDKGGTGLGLAIVKAIIEAHNGQVAAKSEGVGKGSTFFLELPLGEG